MAKPKLLKVQKADSTWLELPFCYYTVTPQTEYKEYTMQSGINRKQNIGIRIKITGSIDYISQTDLTAFNTIARTGGYHVVQYVDELGVTSQGNFTIKPFAPTLFAYKNNAPVWHNVSIDMVAQGVV